MSGKCVLYWPERRGIYGKVEVLINSVRECDHYTIRNLTLKQGGQCCSVKHYWYTSWPDHKTPDSAQPLLQLITEAEEDRKASAGRGPVIVHCSAGIGRTGCFIATTTGCRQLKQEGVVDVLSIACQLRLDRHGPDRRAVRVYTPHPEPVRKQTLSRCQPMRKQGMVILACGLMEEQSPGNRITCWQRLNQGALDCRANPLG
ncbi:receptor-type tyrosine-protein phosphatase R-like [Huso huso]|uniref:protein-tyrosine-phosphatase n=1 Tax=Huso huso TaxID=61971 RepID=A0ABR0ZCA3_HUSHU